MSGRGVIARKDENGVNPVSELKGDNAKRRGKFDWDIRFKQKSHKKRGCVAQSRVSCVAFGRVGRIGVSMSLRRECALQSEDGYVMPVSLRCYARGF